MKDNEDGGFAKLHAMVGKVNLSDADFGTALAVTATQVHHRPLVVEGPVKARHLLGSVERQSRTGNQLGRKAHQCRTGRQEHPQWRDKRDRHGRAEPQQPAERNALSRGHPMGPARGKLRVLQLHPSRSCNLGCSRCYSGPNPYERQTPPEAMALGLFDDAAVAGCKLVGFSGGEPLMYGPPRAPLRAARVCGKRTTVTTNDILLSARRIRLLQGVMALVAISLDGDPASRDRMRRHPRACSAMARRLPALRDSGPIFGFHFTLSQSSLDELIWAADIAVEQSAGLLQVHPLEAVGWPLDDLEQAIPDETELMFAVPAVARLKELAGDRIVIQLHVAGRDAMAESRKRVFAGHDWPGDEWPRVALQLPLNVAPVRTVVPAEYDLGRLWPLGKLHEALLPALAARWRQHLAPGTRDMCRGAHRQATSADPTAVVKKCAPLAQASAQGSALEASAAGEACGTSPPLRLSRVGGLVAVPTRARLS